MVRILGLFVGEEVSEGFPVEKLAFSLRQLKHWRLRPAADPEILPDPEPRAMGKRLIVPSIGGRDVACAEWPNVRRFEHFF